MRAYSSDPFFKMTFFRSMVMLMLAAFVAGGGVVSVSGQNEGVMKAEEAAMALVRPLEKEGFAFRAESWLRELTPEMGKAIKVQLFKGNDYRFCIAVPPESGVKVTATVLDFAGKPGGRLRVLEEGWGLVLEYQPQKTGTYVVAIRQLEEGSRKKTLCAMFTGYQ
jgi:hypothetical protein